MFDLDRAIVDWKRQLKAAGIRSVEALDELETHLRDHVEGQLAKGSTPEQAFGEAVTRLGPSRALREEYSKVTPNKFEFLPRVLRVACLVTTPVMFLSGAWNLLDGEMTSAAKVFAWIALCAGSAFIAGLPFYYRSLPDPEKRGVGICLKLMSAGFGVWPIIALLDAIHLIHLHAGNSLLMICWDVYVVTVFTGLAYACRAVHIAESSAGLLDGTCGELHEQALAALEAARNEAIQLGHDYIGTEHLLLGILSTRSALLGRILSAARVEPQAARLAIQRMVGTGRSQAEPGSLPYTPRSENALCIAAKEARAMNHPCICLEHIFLGLLLEPGGVAGKVLREFGFDIRKARTEVLRGFKRDDGEGPAPVVAG
jgi:hypothetical protein